MGGLRSELSLAGERLRGTRAVAERMDREHGTLTARIAEALEELRAGESEERTGREALSRIGRECLSVHQNKTELRRKLEEERGRVRRGRLRLERLRGKEGKASASLASLAGEIAGTAERAVDRKSVV